MGSVHIKDEERVGSEAKYKLEPSVYLQKLYESGTPDLGWMNQMGEWGTRAKPGNLGLRLKDIEIGSYGIIPEHGGAHIAGELLRILIRERKMGGEFARLRKQRRKGVGAEGLKLVDMDEERRPILRRLVATRHGDELQMGEQERPDEI